MAKRNREIRKRVNGVEHKLCTGPLHREGQFVRIEDGFYKRGNGKVRPQCKACEASYLNSEPYVPRARMDFAIQECIFRIGKAELARRLEIRQKTVSQWVSTTKPQRYMKRRTARALISLLHELRANNVVRHKKDIKHGSAARGKPERVPTAYSHFNGPNARNIEDKRKQRSRTDPEILRQKWREEGRKRAERRREQKEKLTEAA